MINAVQDTLVAQCQKSKECVETVRRSRTARCYKLLLWGGALCRERMFLNGAVTLTDGRRRARAVQGAAREESMVLHFVLAELQSALQSFEPDVEG